MEDRDYFRQAKLGIMYDSATGEPISDARFKLNEFSIDDKVSMDDFKLGGEVVASAAKDREMKVQFTAGSYKNVVFEKMTNAVVTDITENAAGQIVGFANVQGDSVYDADTGISSIYIDDKDKLLNASIHIKALSASTVEVKIYNVTTDYTSDPLTVSSGAYTSTGIADYGIALLGGSGTIALTIADTAVAESVKPGFEGEDIFIDGNNDFDEVGMRLYPDAYNSSFTYIDVFRVKFGGLKTEVKDSWSTWTGEATLLKDDDQGTAGGYYKIHRLKLAE